MCVLCAQEWLESGGSCLSVNRSTVVRADQKSRSFKISSKGKTWRKRMEKASGESERMEKANGESEWRKRTNGESERMEKASGESEWQRTKISN
jgi:hypothetical protein